MILHLLELTVELIDHGEGILNWYKPHTLLVLVKLDCVSCHFQVHDHTPGNLFIVDMLDLTGLSVEE